MKIFDTRDIKEIDAYTIKHEPVNSVDLMERAARECTEWLSDKISTDLTVSVFAGPGNNGGDGWAIARILADKGYKVRIFQLLIDTKLSPDLENNRDRLQKQAKIDPVYIRNQEDFPVPDKSGLLIDALFGSGLSRPLEGLSLQLVKHINNSGCRVVSIDMPSGLFGEDNSLNNAEGIIRASDTLTLQFPKRSFFFSENEKYTGNWHIIPIGLHPSIIKEKQTGFYLADEELIRPLIKIRKKFSHKGLFGHGLLIAGSHGMMGAAILAARACLRTGAGLLTTHIPGLCYPIIQSAVPESIFSVDPNTKIFSECPYGEGYNAIAAGPGIGKDKTTATAIEFLLKNSEKSLLLDADAINIIAENKNLLNLLPENSIITPHPGEFDRLAGSSLEGFERNQKQISMSCQYRIIIVLKGAYTSVTMPNGNCYFNSTGNPGMSTAGSGDVLTGMILSLLAQGYSPEEAALVGVYIHGLAGDIALSYQSMESLIASDIVEHIGNAFNKIRKNEKSVA